MCIYTLRIVISGFGVWGLGFGVWGLGFGVWAQNGARSEVLNPGRDIYGIEGRTPKCFSLWVR